MKDGEEGMWGHGIYGRGTRLMRRQKMIQPVGKPPEVQD